MAKDIAAECSDGVITKDELANQSRSEIAKPCPFCGCDLDVDGPRIRSKKNCDGLNQFYVICEDCDASGPWAETKKEAIEAWNDRSGDFTDNL